MAGICSSANPLPYLIQRCVIVLVCGGRDLILRPSVKTNAEEAIGTGKAAEKDAKAARAEAKKAEANAKKAETARKKSEAAAEAAQSAAETARSEAEKLRLEKAAVEVRLAGTQQALADAGMQPLPSPSCVLQPMSVRCP
jgi:hypothetical protein